MTTLDDFLIAADFLEDHNMCNSVVESLRDMQKRVLDEFLGPNHPKIDLSHPIHIGGWSYFSDGRAMIRLRGDWSEGQISNDGKKVRKCWDDNWTIDPDEIMWAPWPVLSNKSSEEYSVIASRKILNTYIKKIGLLGDVQAAVDFDDEPEFDFNGRRQWVIDYPLLFRFRFGEGMVMPLGQEKNNGT